MAGARACASASAGVSKHQNNSVHRVGNCRSKCGPSNLCPRFGKTKPNLKTNSIVVVDCQRTRGHSLFQEDSDSVIRTHANRQAVHELAECVMPIRIDRLHPAVKHGAYSAIDVLPGESRAAFEKLHPGLNLSRPQARFTKQSQFQNRQQAYAKKSSPRATKASSLQKHSAWSQGGAGRFSQFRQEVRVTLSQICARNSFSCCVSLGESKILISSLFAKSLGGFFAS